MPKSQTIIKDTDIPARSGYYIIRSKQFISHIGTSSNLRNRVRTLVSPRHHRGSDEVLCVAYCTKTAPEFNFVESKTAAEARFSESKAQMEI